MATKDEREILRERAKELKRHLRDHHTVGRPGCEALGNAAKAMIAAVGEITGDG